MDHGVAAINRRPHAGFVLDVTDDEVIDVYAERFEGLLDTRRVADKKPDAVPGLRNCLDGVGTDEAGAPGYQNLQAVQPNGMTICLVSQNAASPSTPSSRPMPEHL